MYATSTHVHQGHNPHYIPQLSIPNGHAQHPFTPIHHQQPSPQPPPPPPLPPPSQRPPPHPTPTKDRITVAAVPSVSIECNKLVVGNSQSSKHPPFHCLSLHSRRLPSLQVPRVPTHPSRYLAMAPLAQSGCAIGMGPYPPIRPCPPCSVVPERDRSGLVKDSSQSSV